MEHAGDPVPFSTMSFQERGPLMSHLPFPEVAFFLLTIVVSLLLFGFAVRGSKSALLLCLLWIGAQSGIGLSGFYLSTKTLPPHFFAAVVPPMLVLVSLLFTGKGRRFMTGMSLKWSVLIHSIRILVEVNLYVLFLYKQVPIQMTFEAGNLDILIGVTAPAIWWAFRKKYVGRRGLVIWNSVALLSVLNALGRAMLSAPFRFQQFAFDQPTIAILYFPFVLLPAFLVPAVLLCHCVVFRKLLGSLLHREDHPV
jgi:hypothetical protein